MQVKKEEVRNKILKAAKKEFLKCGYDKASIRNISKAAEISHGNIKIYFKNKETLFTEVVKPAICFLDNYLLDSVEYNGMSENQLNEFLDLEITKKNQLNLFLHVKENRELFEILFFKSESSKYRKIRERYTSRFQNISDNFIAALSNKKIIEKRSLNRMFKHTLSVLFIVGIEEIILNNPGEEEIKAYVEDFSRFTHYGTFSNFNKSE